MSRVSVRDVRHEHIVVHIHSFQFLKELRRIFFRIWIVRHVFGGGAANYFPALLFSQLPDTSSVFLNSRNHRQFSAAMIVDSNRRRYSKILSTHWQCSSRATLRYPEVLVGRRLSRDRVLFPSALRSSTTPGNFGPILVIGSSVPQAPLTSSNRAFTPSTRYTPRPPTWRRASAEPRYRFDDQPQSWFP